MTTSFLNPLNWFRRRRNGLRLSLRADLYERSHAIAQLEGIGPAHERQLARVGIVDTDQLLAHPAAAVAAAIDTPEKRVRTWQATAELAAVECIRPLHAEALARGGVTGVRDLVARDAKLIADKVNQHLGALGTRPTGGRMSEAHVRTWQRAARAMKRRKVPVRLSEAPPRSGPTPVRSADDGSRVRGTPRAAAQPPRQATRQNVKPPAVKTGTRTSNTRTAPARPPCAAVTAAGTPCKRSARAGSKHCASHEARRAPAVTLRTPSTAPKARKVPQEPRRVHVTHNGYRLYQKGNRYYFSKKAQDELARDGAEPVYRLPPDREILVTQNGLPVLKGR